MFEYQPLKYIYKKKCKLWQSNNHTLKHKFALKHCYSEFHKYRSFINGKKQYFLLKRTKHFFFEKTRKLDWNILILLIALNNLSIFTNYIYYISTVISIKTSKLIKKKN